LALTFLHPPFRVFDAAAPRPGSILIIRADADPLALIEALEARFYFPWCPLCICGSPSSAFARLLSALRPNAAACVGSLVTSAEFSPATVVAAVAARPEPTTHDLALFVGLRCARPDIVSTLASIASRDRGTTAHRTTVWRRLLGFPPLGPRQWSKAFRLIGVLGRVSFRRYQSVERLALDAGVDARSLRRWTRQLLAMEPSDVAERPGWEWILEVLLRRNGYVDAGAVESISDLAHELRSPDPRFDSTRQGCVPATSVHCDRVSKLQSSNSRKKTALQAL
jgi:hypothetical protein